MASAGWVSNRHSERCIQRAIEFALHSMQARGHLGALMKQWMPIASCEDAVDETGVDVPGDRRRRLKGSASSWGAAGEGASTDEAQFQLQVADFFGLFLLWALCTFVAVVVKLSSMLWAHRKRARGSARAERASAVGGKTMLTVETEGADTANGLEGGHKLAGDEPPSMLWRLFTSSEYPRGLDINNTSAMLRYLVKQDQGNKAALTKLEELLTMEKSQDTPRHETTKRRSKATDDKDESLDNAKREAGRAIMAKLRDAGGFGV